MTIDDVATKEFEAGLSLLHMMQRPTDASTEGTDTPAALTTPPSTKKRAGSASGATTPRPAKKARDAALLATGSLLLAAAQQVDPMQHHDDDDDDDDFGDDSEWGGDMETGSPRDAVRRNAQLHTLTRELTIEELREHFNKPIVDVAKEFGICTTFLKKICRRCGIKRWPHRQIRSLTRSIEMLHEAEANATSVQEKAKYAAQIAQMEAKKRAVIYDPDANGKLERVKKSVLSRSGTPGRKNSSGSSPKSMAASLPPQVATLQANLLHAVAAAASTMSVESTVAISALKPSTTAATAAEAAAAEALLFSASPRTTVTSIDVNIPVEDLAADALPAMTPTASSTPKSTAQRGLKISPSHRKLLTGPRVDGESCKRAASLGSLQNLDGPKPPAQDVEVATAPVAAQAS